MRINVVTLQDANISAVDSFITLRPRHEVSQALLEIPSAFANVFALQKQTLALLILVASVFTFLLLYCLVTSLIGFADWWWPGSYEDFRLLATVSEVTYKGLRMKMNIRLTAGSMSTTTPHASKGMFHCQMSLRVAGGTTDLLVEALSVNDVVLAWCKIDILEDVLVEEAYDKLFAMKGKFRTLASPCVRLSLRLEEKEGGVGVSTRWSSRWSPSRWSMRHTGKAGQTARQTGRGAVDSPEASSLSMHGREALAASRALRDHISVAVEVFGGLGTKTKAYISIEGSPLSQRFVLGIWQDEAEYEKKLDAEKEIDILRIDSAAVDPARVDVFVVGYLDHRGVRRTLRCRLLDVPAREWVDTLHQIIARAREHGKVRKKERATTMAESKPADYSRDEW